MKKNYLFYLFLLVVSCGVYSQFMQTINLPQTLNTDASTISQTLEPCEQPTNLFFNYEIGMPVGELSWNGAQPQEGWIILLGRENTTDIDWFLSDPENYENPEVKMERVYNSPSHQYTNMFEPGFYEIYVIADCGGNGMMASEKISFEIGDRVEEIIENECEAPHHVVGIQNNMQSIDLTWESQDGGLYQIAWGPFGAEMHEGYFNDPQAGSVIVYDNPYHLEFSGSASNIPHSIYIRKYCGGNNFSEWVKPTCPAPSEVNSQTNDDQIILSWTALEYQFAWQVIYGPQGFDPNNEGTPDVTRLDVYQNPTQVLLMLNLLQGINYEFYVRTLCSGEAYSDWRGPGYFSTIFLPCDPVNNIQTSHITHKSVDIIWAPQGGESQWEVTYGLAPLNIDESSTMVVTNPKAILMGLESSSDYEFFVTSNCVSGEAAQSEINSFTTTESDDLYCIPYFLSGCTLTYIDNLILNGENETRLYDLNTGCTESNYENRTDRKVDLAPGNQYFTRVSTGNFPISGLNLAIWIDFNDDGVFDESERVGDGALEASGFTNINFSIPQNANTGEHRMRVMLAFNAYAYQLTPCNEGDSYSTTGEAYDYTVNILDLQDCNLAASGTVISDFAVCPFEDFQIATLGASEPALGLIRKWQSSPAGQGIWTDLSVGLLPNTIIYGGIQQATDYRYIITCTQSGLSSTSNILKVTMSANCYCIPESNCAGPGLQINNVNLVGETITLDNESGCSGNGYGDFSIKFAPDLKKGETYSVSVTAYNSHLTDDKIKVWIDYNNNKVFDPEEVILDYPNGLPDHTVTSPFLVPTNIPSGIYRMRVRIGWWGSISPITGCSTLGDGETEDYLVEIIPGEAPEECLQPSDLSVEQGSSPTSITASWLPGAGETKWQLVYGLTGINPNNEEPIIVNNDPNALIENLEPETNYDVYVRAVCDDNNLSDWKGPVTINTDGLSLEDLSFEGFTYYPVPAGDRLNLKSQNVIEKVTITNISGQDVLKFYPSSKNPELDVSQLNSGVYFMRVQFKDKSKVFKIIKK